MKALHTPDTTTLLMNTVLLISSGKYHSYFTLSPLSREATLRPHLPTPSCGDGWGVYPHKALEVLLRVRSSQNPKGHLIKGQMEA